MMRRYLSIFLFVVSSFFVSDPAAAARAEAARQFVDTMGQRVLAVINSPNLDETEKQRRLQQMFAQHVDIPWMGQFVLGPAWRNATAEQRQRYIQAYQQYLLARYTTNFADYAGTKYVITGVRPEGDNEFIVAMQIKAPTQAQETEAGYRLRADASGQFKITDIIIEGVSLLTTQRSEFASVVQRRGMDGLIQSVENKVQEEQARS